MSDVTRERFIANLKRMNGEVTHAAAEAAWLRYQRAEAEKARRVNASPFAAATTSSGTVVAERAAPMLLSPADVARLEAAARPFGGVSIGDPPIAHRVGDRLELVLLFPPRTKKNSKQNIATQSKAYIAFRNAVRDHLARFRDMLGLPLPDRPYNLAAVFYTDSPGDRADRFGLEQGLADALQDAGVVTDDWLFRTGDGTRVVSDHARPRVELTITPILESR